MQIHPLSAPAVGASRTETSAHGPDCPHCKALASAQGGSDTVVISEDARRRGAPEKPDGADGARGAHGGDAPAEEPKKRTYLTAEEQREVDRLKARDREVRAHEQAHKAAASGYAGTIHYEFERGPDGGRYAVAGHVPIDVAEIPDDPKATIAKARQVRAAALAPGDPSPADRSIASRAIRMEQKARAELRADAAEESSTVGHVEGSDGTEPAHQAPDAGPAELPTTARAADRMPEPIAQPPREGAAKTETDHGDARRRPDRRYSEPPASTFSAVA